MKPPLLIVVQDRETQFDAPFYAYITAAGDARVRVYYTQEGVEGDAVPLDAELGRPPAWDHLAGLRYPHRRHPLNGWSTVRALANEILADQPDLVILSGYYPHSHLLLALLLRAHGLRIGLRTDSTLEHADFSGWRGILKRLLLPRLLALYGSWHPVGGLAGEYLRRIGRGCRPIHPFPYAVDNAWLATEAARWEAARQGERARLGWNTEDFVVLGILKWNQREDPLTLVRGFLRLLESQPGARLVLVGDGPQRPAVEALVRSAGDRVYLPGYLPYSELPRWYALCDVFVHPAASEPWGVSVNEAMACARPVVASSGVGAGHDLIRPGVTGTVFPSGDAAALAEALAALKADPAACRRQGVQAREAVGGWSYAASWHSLRAALGPGAP